MITAFLPIFSVNLLWYAGMSLTLLCLGNIASIIYSFSARFISLSSTTAEGFNGKDARITSNGTTSSPKTPLRPPRTIARDSSASLPKVRTPRSPAHQSSLHPVQGNVPSTTTTMHRSPLSIHASPATPRSPGFGQVYGASTERSAKTLGIGDAETLGKSPIERRAALNCASILSTPLPDTGSPRVNKIVENSLPHWTDSLRDTIQGRTQGITSPPASGKVMAKPENPPKPAEAPQVPKRRIVSPERSLVELGLRGEIELVTDNLRKWLCHKIFKPLAADITLVTEEFHKAGIEHLAPQFPATFSLFSSSTSRLSANGLAGNTSSTMIMVTGSAATSSLVSASRPQTLMELSQKYYQDPIVQKRIRIERYLSFSALYSHRSSIVRRVVEMAEEDLVSSFKHSAPSLGLESSLALPQQIQDDISIILNLFCTFMDENLPSDVSHASQPFSTLHFVTADGHESQRPDAIQIHQSNVSVPHFELIAGDCVYETAQGSHNSLYHAIIFMVEYAHRFRNGYLGLGNLGTASIDLISILDTFPY